MRILLLTHYYEPEIGAPQQRWGALVEHFSAAGHTVRVLAPAPHYPAGSLLPGGEGMTAGRVHDGLHGERVHRVTFAPYAAGVGSRLHDQLVAAGDMVRTGSRRFARHRPDVVIATVPSIPTLAAGAAVARRLGAPLVAEIRDAWPDLLAVSGEWDAATGRPARPAVRDRVRPTAMRLAAAATTLLQQRSAAVVTTTESFAAVLRARGVPAVTVVRNGAHPFPAGPPPGRAVAGGALRVLYAGTLGRSQGLGTAVLAAAAARRAGTDVVLRIIGDGAEREALQSLARAEDSPVEFLPPVPRERLVEHYGWADTALVALRPWPALSLTIPSKLYEALSLGVHVTASLSGEAARLITATGAGDVCDPGDPDALSRLWRQLANERGRLSVGSAGRRWVEDNARDDVLAERYLTVLGSVVGRRA